MSVNPGDLGVRATAAAVAAGSLSARERLDAALARIAERDGAVGAFLEVWEREARTRAERIDRDPQLRSLPLAGVPVAIKDNLCVQGHVAAAASRMLASYVAPYTATAVQRLLEAGAVIVGRTNLDEFSMGSSCENSALGVTRHPQRNDRVPGGSSGGSAAAVAAGMVPAALGSDTGGSIRQPAAFCGVAGLKPTYGRVSRYGLIAFASSLDQIGPLAADVADLAPLLHAIAGHDDRDATSLPEPPPPAEVAPADPRGLRIGVPEAWFGDGLQGAVRDNVQAALARLESAGARLVPVTLPHQRYAVATYYVIATAEASANLARYDGVRYGYRAAGGGDWRELIARSRSEGFGAEVKRRILLGTYVLCAGYQDAYYARAQRVRTLLRRDFDAAFAEVDVVAGPTTPTTAFRLGDKLDDPLAMYLNDVYTVTANLAGLPALSLPCGCDAEGLPVGLQLVAPPLQEQRLLAVARAVEELLSTG